MTDDARFVLYEEDGVFGVLDRVGPQVYFTETRARAIEEVERANDVVARYPTTISMRHLREMDAAWRDARGLPPLPEPQGTRLIVPVEPTASANLHTQTEPRPEPPTIEPDALGEWTATSPREDLAMVRVGTTLSTAAEVAARMSMQQRVAGARTDLDRTLRMSEELATAAAAADAPFARFRTALLALYADHAGDAETTFRGICAAEGPDAAVRALTENPRSLLPGSQYRPLRGGPHARATAVESAILYAPYLARVDRLVDAAKRHAGVPPESMLLVPDLQARLVEMIPAQQRVHAATLADYRTSATRLATPTRLRREWDALQPGERAAVRTVLPAIDQLVRPARVRGREHRGSSPDR